MNGNGHHELAPSSFPAWAQCPAFDSDPAERADATEGTHQHSVLAALLFGNDARLAELSQDAAEAVTWAADYVRALAGGQAIRTEQSVSYTAPDSFAPGVISEVFSGTADAIIIHPPGNMADLTIVFESRPGLGVPTAAVLVRNGQNVVFVVQDGQAVQRDVQTGLQNDGWTEILSGLEAGETVVTEGQTQLRDGLKVEVL